MRMDVAPAPRIHGETVNGRVDASIAFIDTRLTTLLGLRSKERRVKETEMKDRRIETVLLGTYISKSRHVCVGFWFPLIQIRLRSLFLIS